MSSAGQIPRPYVLILVDTSAGVEFLDALYRSCRRGGETARKLIDWLIAAVAVRAALPVLQADGDLDALARHVARQSAVR